MRTVVDFYLNGLVANGWRITEDGAGLANQITFRASKGKRTFAAYAEKQTDGQTKLTAGLNQGF